MTRSYGDRIITHSCGPGTTADTLVNRTGLQETLEATRGRLKAPYKERPALLGMPDLRREHPGEQIPDRRIFTQPWPAGPNRGRRDPDDPLPVPPRPGPAALRGIDEQVARAEQAVAGPVPGQAQPVHPPDRRHPDREPGTRPTHRYYL
jgi:hypothetical protein